VVLLATTDRRGTHYKHVTVPDAVKVGVSSDITTITVTGSHCTGGNRSEFILREGKKLLSCIQTVRFIVREQTVTELYTDCKVHCEAANSTELYRDCKVHCEGANLLSCVETVRFNVREQTVLSCIETVRFIVREQTVTELYRDCKVHCEGANSTELYRDCKVHCEGAKRCFVSCVKYRQIVNCEFNLQFFKPKEVRISQKNYSRKNKWERNRNSVPSARKKNKQEKRQQQINSR
jgi:hypothetical protein